MRLPERRNFHRRGSIFAPPRLPAPGGCLCEPPSPARCDRNHECRLFVRAHAIDARAAPCEHWAQRLPGIEPRRCSGRIVTREQPRRTGRSPAHHLTGPSSIMSHARARARSDPCDVGARYATTCSNLCATPGVRGTRQLVPARRPAPGDHSKPRASCQSGLAGHQVVRTITAASNCSIEHPVRRFLFAHPGQHCRNGSICGSLAGDQHERDHVQRDALSLVARCRCLLGAVDTAPFASPCLPVVSF